MYVSNVHVGNFIRKCEIKVITKLPNSEQSYKGKLQLKIKVCFEKNHMSTPPSSFSITDFKNQVPHKHCRSTEGQTRVEQFLDLHYTKMYKYKRISETESNCH